MGETTDPHDCQLYIISPPHMDAAFPARLDEVLSAVPGRVGAFQLRLELTDEPTLVAAVQTLLPICHSHNVAFVLAGSASDAIRLEADAVHVEAGASIKEARQAIGDKMQLGAACGNSPDAAMRAGEQGADYVAFGSFDDSAIPEIELLEWWQRFFVLPCVAAGKMAPENCAAYVAAGADFIAAGKTLWDYPGGAIAAAQAFDATITEALQSL